MRIWESARKTGDGNCAIVALKAKSKNRRSASFGGFLVPRNLFALCRAIFCNDSPAHTLLSSYRMKVMYVRGVYVDIGFVPSFGFCRRSI